MPRQLALLICIILILYLFWVDRKKNEGVSRAIWIPFIWMFLAGSRYVSAWIGLGSIETFADPTLEGSPVDMSVFLILILSGALILIRRRPNWRKLFAQNIWMSLFFIFAVLSIIWSDYSFVSFKRWIKVLGNVIMALIILTEQRPYEALSATLRRLAFVLLPLSVLFIRYYPELGRAYHMGNPMYTGVSNQKNGLGQICLLCGIYFSWNILLHHQHKAEMRRGLHFSIYFIIIPMIAWLLYVANSATSFLCMFVTVSLFMIARQNMVARNPHRILTICFTFILLFVGLELFLNFSDTVIAMLGRSSDLTTRVPMWNGLLEMVENPLIGSGYGAFLSGERYVLVTERWGVAQTHNSYLQTYLDLGLVGVILLVGWILAGLRKVAKYLTIDYPAAVLRICFIFIVALVSWTESVLHGVSNMSVLLILGALDINSLEKSVN